MSKKQKKSNKKFTSKLVTCPECNGYGGDFDCFDGHNPVLINPCHLCLGLGSIDKVTCKNFKNKHLLEVQRT